MLAPDGFGPHEAIAEARSQNRQRGGEAGFIAGNGLDRDLDGHPTSLSS